MVDYYVNKTTGATLVDDNDDDITELLWGDPLHLEADWNSDTRWAYVRARGEKGWIRKSLIRKKSSTYNGLLEFYIIDVGQGDGALVRTPDDNWHMIDAGVPNSRQMTKKGAANFVRWKFYEDLRESKIRLHSLTASHPDYDHYGGMLDLLSGKLYDGRTFDVEVENFYHTGMGRFDGSNPLGKMTSGSVDPFPQGDHGIAVNDQFITELLGDKTTFGSPPRTLSATFGQLATLIEQKCQRAARLSHLNEYLPEYGSGKDVEVRILGPILEGFGTIQGLRKLGSGRFWEGKTRNGHSLVYRFDYGDARIMMNGDLNAESQRLLLSYIDRKEFAVDVAKGCHHGSEDVDVDFIKATQARATVISSGDNESYAHPRPIVMGASAKYGRESKSPGGIVQAPLLYSTELARSVNLDLPSTVKLDPDFSGPRPPRWFSARTTLVKSRGTSYRQLSKTPIAVDLIYGLVNVRTDGETILCATMLESGKEFDKKLFMAGVNA